MPRLRARRGLSPLVATVVLISAAVVGGLAVYNYFQRSVDTVSATSATLALYVRTSYLTADTQLVYIQAVNLYDKPVNITKVSVVLSDGTHLDLPAAKVKGVPVTVEPGKKATIIAEAPSDATAVYLTYSIGGETLVTEPQSLK